jgi:hypothetical protein
MISTLVILSIAKEPLELRFFFSYSFRGGGFFKTALPP